MSTVNLNPKSSFHSRFPDELIGLLEEKHAVIKYLTSTRLKQYFDKQKNNSLLQN